MTDLLIREATDKDAPRIVALGMDFLALGPYKGQLEENPIQALKCATDFLALPNMKILVAEESNAVCGVFAMLVYPHPFSGQLTATELIWYVEPEHRGRASMELLWAAERMAYDMGAVWMQLTAPSPETSKVYERLKYAPIETSHQARLENRVRH
jgi:hypothetical protein